MIDCWVQNIGLDLCLSVSTNGGQNGYCTAECISAADCPAGYGCSTITIEDGAGGETDIKLCMPFAGYRCTNGAFDCLSQGCTENPFDGGLDYCTGNCTNDWSCPSDYSCQPGPNGDPSRCVPNAP